VKAVLLDKDAAKMNVHSKILSGRMSRRVGTVKSEGNKKGRGMSPAFHTGGGVI
jgi:hypothetical protein